MIGSLLTILRANILKRLELLPEIFGNVVNTTGVRNNTADQTFLSYHRRLLVHASLEGRPDSFEVAPVVYVTSCRCC